MIILYNGRIHSRLASTSAICIEGDRIVAVGTDPDVLNLTQPGSHSINLHGKYVLPGLVDSHIHLDLYSQSLSHVDCETDNYQECLERVKTRALNTPAGAWVTGHGWNQNRWQGGYGRLDDLDLAGESHPVFLTDKSLHSAWVNSQALALAGVTSQTPEPLGGTIQRGPAGELTGILLESAVNMVENIIPKQSASDRKQAMVQGQHNLHQFGITSIHDFDRENCFSTLQEMESEGTLTLRVLKSIPFENLDHAIALGLRSGFGSNHLRVGSVKMFADGALGPQTAAMLRPYEDDPRNNGTLLLTADEIFETGVRATQAGLSLAIHAIGDRATNVVLNGLAMVREYEYQNGLPFQKHRIEHLQLLHPDDLGRAANLKICASMQPVHIYSDMSTADARWGDRSRFAYVFRSLLTNHTMLVFGSDAPVESPNPFWGMHAAVTRSRHDSTRGSGGWYPHERITLQEVLDGYTINPAIQAGTQSITGTLECGKLADLVILNQNPFKVNPNELFNINPLSVMVNGTWVFQGFSDQSGGG